MDANHDFQCCYLFENKSIIGWGTSIIFSCLTRPLSERLALYWCQRMQTACNPSSGMFEKNQVNMKCKSSSISYTTNPETRGLVYKQNTVQDSILRLWLFYFYQFTEIVSQLHATVHILQYASYFLFLYVFQGPKSMFWHIFFEHNDTFQFQKLLCDMWQLVWITKLTNMRKQLVVSQILYNTMLLIINWSF